MNQPFDDPLERLKQGPGFTKDREETAANLVEEHRPQLERKIRAQPGHVHGQTDDEMQGVHLRMNQVVRKEPRTFESRDALLKYINRVIASVALDSVRKEQGRSVTPASSGTKDAESNSQPARRRGHLVALSEEMAEVLEGREPDPAELSADGPPDDEQLFQQFKNSLPKDIRNIWEMRFQRRLSWKEIGREFQDTPAAIRMRFTREVMKARDKLELDA